VLVPIAFSLVYTSHVRTVGSPSERLSQIPQFTRDGLSIFASALVPPQLAFAPVKAFVLLAATGVVLAAAIRCWRRHDSEVRVWLYRFAAGAFAVAVAYVMFLGSGLFPRWSGLDDRANTFAQFGFVVAAYSVLALLALLLANGAGSPAAAILAALSLLVGLGFVQRVREDIHGYDRAAAQQDHELARLAALLPHLPHSSSVFVFGYPSASAPGVPIFPHPWDLGAAVRLFWDDSSLRAVPVYQQGVSCGRTTVRDYAYDAATAGPYGRTIFVDLATGRVRRIGSRSECQAAHALFRPGRLLAATTP
jgi:hypothetical protein